jgi:non-ribosomal peptide synthetase component F
MEVSDFLHLNAKSGSIIAMIDKSSWETCACFLGIIDSGCVALLIDENWSLNWREIVLQDAQPVLILSSNKDCLINARELIPGLYGVNYSRSPRYLGKEASYLIYTSGTTGQPKGVINSIKGLINLFKATKKIFSLKSSDTVLQFSSPSFDAWVWDICMAFSSGASLAIPEVDKRLPGNIH